MILKIKTNDGWQFLEEILKIEVIRNCEFDEKMSNIAENKIYYKTLSNSIINAFNDYTIDTKYNENSDYTIVCCVVKEGDIIYSLNTETYLLNNDGKTIERIH